jgi:hypothetical protein
MAKTVKVLADLSIQNGEGEIRIKNDQDGSLVFDFPSAKSFNSLSSVPIPFKPSFQAIGKANAALMEQRQPVIVRVDDEDWLVLGRDRKPSVKYFKLAPFYLKKQFSWKTALYIAGGGLGAALTYLAVKKRN